MAKQKREGNGPVHESLGCRERKPSPPPPPNFPIMTMVWVVAWMRKASGVIEFILIMYNRERRILNNQVSNIDTY